MLDEYSTHEELRRYLDGVLDHSKRIENDIKAYVSRYIACNYPDVQTPRGRTDLEGIQQVHRLISQLDTSLLACTTALINTKLTLLRRRNTLVNVNTLPVEILQPILVEAAGLDARRKFTIASTCSRWRDVCFAYPPFWSRFALPPSAEEAQRMFNFARRQGHPLHLVLPGRLIGIHAPVEKALRNTLIAHLDLIRSVEAVDWPGGGWLEKPFHALEELHVTRPPHLVDDGILPWYAGQQERAPRLRRATFINCRLNYIPKSYAGLRTLSITYPRSPEPSLVGADRHLADVLRACPDLEELTLVCVPNVPVRTLDPTTKVIPLPKLRYLKLRLEIVALTAMLGQMRTSSALATVMLSGYIGWRAPPDHLYPRLLRLSSPKCLPMLSSLASLTVHNHPCDRKEVQVSSPTPDLDADITDVGSSSSPYLKLGLTWPDGDARSLDTAIYEWAFSNFLDSARQMHNNLAYVQRVAIVGYLPEPCLAQLIPILRERPRKSLEFRASSTLTALCTRLLEDDEGRQGEKTTRFS